MRDIVKDGQVEGCAVGAGLGAEEDFGWRLHGVRPRQRISLFCFSSRHRVAIKLPELGVLAVCH